MEFEYRTILYGEGERTAIETFIKQSDTWFTPSLSTITDVSLYANKLFERGTKFVCLDGDRIIGMAVAYINKAPL